MRAAAVIVVSLLISLNSFALVEGDLDNIFDANSQTPVRAQELIKSWFKANCRENLSWILSITEDETSNNYCTLDEKVLKVTTVVQLSHLSGDFIFSYDQERDDLTALYKEYSTWNVCWASGIEVGSEEALCR